MMLDHTHDAHLRSWVKGADDHPEFPIQNLPLCSFSDASCVRRGGVAIGDYILDLQALAEAGLVDREDLSIVATAAQPKLNDFFALASAQRRQLRSVLSGLLTAGHPAKHQAERLLVPMDEATLYLPADVPDYTDFFAGIHHAMTAGRMFRPDNPLLPNYKHVPIAYHGRSSSVRASGHPVVHPVGQRAVHGGTTPDYGPSRRLDYELEIAIWISGGNQLGEPIPIDRAAEQIVGFGLLNDWSARDIQAWETQPLGPFLGKNFLTTVSPFVVTSEALAPFRCAQPARAEGDPRPLPYLLDEEDQANGALDMTIEVLLLTPAMREHGRPPVVLARASGLDLYWTPAQMVAHHSSNGCDLRAGDLFGTGTVSGPGPEGHGSLLEMTSAGKNPVTLPSGETRTFLEDGDEVILRGWCEREGYARIGFGEARGTVFAPSSKELLA